MVAGTTPNRSCPKGLHLLYLIHALLNLVGPHVSAYPAPPGPPGLLRRGLSTTVSTFADLSSCVTTDSSICVVDTDIDITSTISISGVTSTVMSTNSAALSGQGSTQLFDIRGSGTQVSFSGLTFKSGSISTVDCGATHDGAPYNACAGGCVFAYNSVDVAFTSSTFQDCTAAYVSQDVLGYGARLSPGLVTSSVRHP